MTLDTMTLTYQDLVLGPETDTSGSDRPSWLGGGRTLGVAPVAHLPAADASDSATVSSDRGTTTLDVAQGAAGPVPTASRLVSMVGAAAITGGMLALASGSLLDGSFGHAVGWLGLAVAAAGNAAADWIMLQEGA